MQKIDYSLSNPKYLNGAENMDISIELMYFGPRIFK